MRDELRVAATTENVREVCDFVRDIAKRQHLSENVVFDVDLAVDEAVTNIVRHAYAPDQAGDIAVAVEVTDDDISITLTDWGKTFEADASHLAVDVPLEVRAQGGMGVLLIDRLMDEVVRTTAPAPGAPNVLTMIKYVGR